jgi:hypothetical protein
MSVPTAEQTDYARTVESRLTALGAYRRNGVSHMPMPDGSLVCLGHDAPFELAASMTLAVHEAWENR